MSAKAEMVSLVNDIRLDFDRGQGTLGEVRDRIMEIAPRALAEDGKTVVDTAELKALRVDRENLRIALARIAALTTPEGSA